MLSTQRHTCAYFVGMPVLAGSYCVNFDFHRYETKYRIPLPRCVLQLIHHKNYIYLGTSSPFETLRGGEEEIARTEAGQDKRNREDYHTP